MLSLIPAAIVIVMMLMGKEIIRNPDVDEVLGMGCVWGGIVLLAAANAVVYFLLSRK